jgi:hypothetical protein
VAGKQYEVIRPFRRTDPRTGVDTMFEVGDVYPGAVDAEPYLLDPGGPDGKGPLIAETATPVTASDSSRKEK